MTEELTVAHDAPVAEDSTGARRSRAAGSSPSASDVPQTVVDTFVTLTEHAPSGMGLLDRDLRYLAVNPALASNNGIAADEHVGRAIADVFPQYAEVIVPVLESVIATGRTVRSLPIRGETQAAVGIERAWEVDCHAVYGTGEHGDRWMAVVLTVTEVTREHRQRQRLVRLQHLSTALTAAGSVDAVARIVTSPTMPRLDSERCALVVVGDDRSRLERYDPAGVIETAAETDDSPAARAIRDRGQTTVADADGGVRILALPLVGSDGVVGAVEWTWSDPVDLDREQAVLSTSAALIAVALGRARSADIRRELAASFQRTLLPTSLPVVPALELAVRYRANVQEARAGGDWYDAFTLPDGSTVLVVGDVVGHSVSSAASMSELRHSLRTTMFSYGDPGDALSRVDAMLTHLTAEPSVMATAAIVCVDPNGDTMRYALAGHMPPLLVRRDGEVMTLSESTGALLGAHLGVPSQTSAVSLRAGDMVALYTDGLIERRGEDIGDGLGRLIAALRAAAVDGPLEQVIGPVLRTMIDEPVSDDVALLLARRTRTR